MASYINVTDQSFQVDVLERSRTVPVVVDFWAPWCGPCRALGPILERLAEQSGGAWVLAKIDTDQNPRVATQLGIQGIPAVKAFKDGRLFDEFVGALPEPQVRAFIERLVPSAEENAIVKADLLRERAPEQAEAIYREILAQKPGNPPATLGLAIIALNRGDTETALTLVATIPDRAEGVDTQALADLKLRLATGGLDINDLRKRVEESPDDLDAQHDLALTLAAQNDYDSALEMLLRIVAKDRTFRDDGARKTMIAIFARLGNDSDITDRWRSKLAQVLYR